MMKMHLHTATCIAVGAGVGIGLVIPIGKIAHVQGQSMRPTLNPNHQIGDYVWVLNSKFSRVCRGDVVILNSPKDERTELIKRVVGVEGDIVLPRRGYSAVEIPKGHCWVEGDNVRSSEDSNHFGPVPMDMISGKATRIIWPITRWGKITSKIPSNREPVCKKTANSSENSQDDDILKRVRF